jgi:hypothetical protein
MSVAERTEYEKKLIRRHWHAGTRLLKEGKTEEGYNLMMRTNPRPILADMYWLKDEALQVARALEKIAGWGDLKKDGNKTFRQIVVRAAAGGNVEALKMLTCGILDLIDDYR